ncbi:MAG: hypothetical protein AAF667_19430 [Pseudomonadota bacterium]
MADTPAVNLMAAHYPPAIRSWFLESGQHVPGNRVVLVSGRQLIEMGVPQC